MKNAFFLILASVSLCYSQAIHFKVVDVQKLNGLSNVAVKSSLVNDVLKTDKDGNVYVNHLKNDTITFFKPFFYPVQLHISPQNYDFKHVIEVVMIPSVARSQQPFQKENLQSFEYHFVHDTLSDSHMKIKTFEHLEATQSRNLWKEKSYRFAHIDIKGKTEKTVDNYSLKDE